MPVCSRPGCVAASVDGELCAVHKQRLGKPCKRCKGVGSCFYVGQGLTMACLDCGGTGLADYKASAPRRKPQDDPVEKRGLITLANE